MEENREKKEKTGFMAQGRSVLIALIAALSAIICVSIFTGGLVDYRVHDGILDVLTNLKIDSKEKIKHTINIQKKLED